MTPDEQEDDYGYEPDLEDIAWWTAQEEQVKSLRSEYHDACRGLRDYHKHTDRQLRGFYKGKKATASYLGQHHQFDVVSDSFEVTVGPDLDFIDTVAWPYDDKEGEGPE